MSRSVEIVYFCDVCQRDGKREIPATTSEEFRFGNSGDRTLDLCDDHFAELQPTIELLLTASQKAIKGGDAKGKIHAGPGSATGPRDHHCPLCATAFTSRQNLRQHVRRTHDRHLSDIELELPPNHNVEDGYPCPDCSFVAQLPQGLGAHRKWKHGIVGSSKTAEVYQAARRAETDHQGELISA